MFWVHDPDFFLPSINPDIFPHTGIRIEDKPKVQPLNSEQTSDLEVTSEEESIVTLSQVVSEASVDELAKSSEK